MNISTDFYKLNPKCGELDCGSTADRGYQVTTSLRWHPLRKDEPDGTVADLIFSFKKEDDAEVRGHLVASIYGNFRVSYMNFTYDGKKPTGAELNFNNSDFVIDVKNSEGADLQTAYQDLVDTVNLYNILTQVSRNITSWLRAEYQCIKHRQNRKVEE